MVKKIILTILLSILSLGNVAYSSDSDLTYTQLTTVDLNTFNEYRFRMTEKYLELRDHFEIYGELSEDVVNDLLGLASSGYKYLPDNLLNKNLYTKLKTALNKGLQYPENSTNYSLISEELLAFLEDVSIDKITGKIEAYPDEGNAPLTVTFRGRVVDPSGTKIPSYNYTWWMDEGGKRKVLSNSKGSSLNYTFKEEGTFTVFLDVTSNHKNVNGNTDVLPFRSRSNVKIKEKVASLIIKVNSSGLRNKSELKFTPDEASYGLVFDATSSTPTGGSTFSKTEWDFGNGVERDNNGGPEVERIVYASEGEYTVTLKLRTNEGKTVERKFVVIVHDPIATINTNQEEGFLGDKFTFSAKSGVNDDDLTYAWEIVDIENDNVIFRKNGKLFTYYFVAKGQYNIILKVTEPSSNEPDIDTKIIYINSKAPIADFTSSVYTNNKPNKILFDATKSYDPDYSDEGKLKFTWIIDGARIELENPNYNGSIGYYTFDSIGDHSVVLEVEDLDGIIVQKTQKVKIKSILSVDFSIFPRVATREQNISFVADSDEAKVYEWDFGDAEKVGGKKSTIKHSYGKSGIFKVKLKVIDKDDNVNSFTRDVYIGDSGRPYAFINMTTSGQSNISYKEGVCNGNGAYIINRVDSVNLSGAESINIDGENHGLTYSWKLGNDNYYTSSSFSKKFDELGCFPVKLVVRSEDNGKTDTKTVWVKVENIKPTLSSVDVTVQDDTLDPVIVNISAIGAQDPDGVIQSYLWYYYTDIDSEPQDFRATRSSNTNFVLPKVTGNYYFVVVMKDNNEARINSEEITGSKYFITLSGDNINTPLVDLSVSNSSVSIGDEVIFTAKVENILGQDITKKVEFSWDLDGDGFYEKGNNGSVIQYSYKTSGEFHAKVKAKYKGFSNTKSTTIGVSNILKPDFSYISIGNKFVFLNKSIGENTSLEWDLGDGTIIKDKESFIHEYKDNKVSHFVDLKVKEGSKSKNYEAKVVKNIKNYIKARKGGLVVFSNPGLVLDEINLDEKEQVYVYLGNSTGDIKNYIIDNDLDYDSNLNGGKDDDEDNKEEKSYTDGSPILIKLNNLRTQKIRVLIRDSAGELIDSYDFIINKLYIEEEIDMSLLDFSGVTNSEKFKIEKLKNYLGELPNEYKLKALMYVQKLQEEWFDNREKTNVILEFEVFINEIPEIDSDEIINVLESLLVEGQEDKSEESITFTALKNLIPLQIKCSKDEDLTETTEKKGGQVSECYLSLVEKLELIRDNNNTLENKILGSEILKVIEIDKLMNNKQKIDFKAILKTLVYGGLGNIPVEEVDKVAETDNGSGSKDVLGLIGTILFWFSMIILGFILIIGLYYLYYLLTNKDKNIGFQDFIIDKTSGIKKQHKEEKSTEANEVADILGDLNQEKELVKKENIPEKPKKDVFAFGGDEDKKDETNKKIEEPKDISIKSEDIGVSLEDKKPEVFDFDKVKKDTDIVDIKEKEEDIKGDDSVPDWLKGSFGSDEVKETKKEEKMEKKTEKPEIVKTEEIKDKSVEVKTKKVEKPKKTGKSKKQEEKIKLPTNEELEEITKVDDSKLKHDIPDWLRGSLTDDKKEETKTEKTKKQDNKKQEKVEEKIKEKDVKKEKDAKKVTTKPKQGNKKQTPEKKLVTEEVKKPLKKEKVDSKIDETKKSDVKKNNKTNGSDLWDDGMKIPDWLKTDD